MWKLVQIHASTGAGEICHDFNSPYYFIYPIITAFKLWESNVHYMIYMIILHHIYPCSWRDTVVGDHSKIDNLVQV